MNVPHKLSQILYYQQQIIVLTCQCIAIIDCKAQYKDFAKGFFANLGISSLSCFRVNALKLGSYFSCDQTDLLSLGITMPEVDHIYGEVAMQRSKENLCGVRKNEERLGSWAG